jgi:NitT/TauT family transport system substrate-binding protein
MVCDYSHMAVYWWHVPDAGHRGVRPQSGFRRTSRSARRLSMSRMSCCEPKALPMCAMWMRRQTTFPLQSPDAKSISLWIFQYSSSPGSTSANRSRVAGIHVGCFELFARDGIRSIADLRGKSVGLAASPPALFGLMAGQVGLDSAKDIHWITDPSVKPLDLFTEGKIDAFLGFPPEPHELRARHAGHVIFSTAVDQPWSQYFCCKVLDNRDYVRKYPIATKRAMRAILKAADICAADPARAARQVVENGLTDRYDYARQTLSELPYDRWREYAPEDTIRFYALRLHEAGLIKSTPQKIIAENTDWRFLNELRRELKM